VEKLARIAKPRMWAIQRNINVPPIMTPKQFINSFQLYVSQTNVQLILFDLDRCLRNRETLDKSNLCTWALVVRSNTQFQIIALNWN